MPKNVVVNTKDIEKQLKKIIGERNMHKIRDAKLFAVPNIVHVLEFAGRNEEEIDKIIPVLQEIYLNKEESKYRTHLNPLELLDRAGYKAWYVNNEQEQNAIGGYFRSQKAVDHGMTGGHPRTSVGGTNGELICTIYTNLDYGKKRFEDYYMVNAVKKEALGDDKLPEDQWHIKPAEQPQREDEYGRSVISIQIAKPNGGFISIKNRYNHTVADPDNTFDSNPDNIIPGLSYALEKHFGVKFNTTNNSLPDNFRMVNDQVVRFYQEIDNVYFGPNYYFSGSNITKLNNDYEYMLDYFILDSRTGEVRTPCDSVKDCAIDILNNEFKGKKINIQTNGNQRIFSVDGVKIATTENGQLVELNLPNTTQINNGFLWVNDTLKSINLPEVKEIGDSFLLNNSELTSINAPKLEKLGNATLSYNKNLTELNLPEVKKIGVNFLSYNKSISSINLPKVESIGHMFLSDNGNLTELNLPKVKSIGDNFLWSNNKLSSINLPKVESIGRSFLSNNEGLKKLNLPEIKKIDNGFLFCNKSISSINLPKVESIGASFLFHNINLTELNLPEIKKIGNGFLCVNEKLTSINLPQVELIEDNFLTFNKSLKELNLPEVKKIGNDFLSCNNSLISINLPHVESIGNNFLKGNGNLIELNLPEVKNIGDSFLFFNKSLKELNLPKVKNIGEFVLGANVNLTSINLPQVESIGKAFCLYGGLTELNLPKVKKIGDSFLKFGKNLSSINLPQVESIGHDFLRDNENLTELNLPEVKEIGDRCLFYNQVLTSINLPKVKKIDCNVIAEKESLKDFYAPELSEEDLNYLYEHGNMVIKFAIAKNRIREKINQSFDNAKTALDKRIEEASKATDAMFQEFEERL